LPNTLDLRRRIRSVKSTEQITKAMKMVAAARLRRAQARIVEARPYADALAGVLRSVAARAGKAHPLLADRPERSVTLVVVTGNKGLAGAFNANILREAMRLLSGGRWEHVDLILIGRKGNDFFRHRGIAALASDVELMNNVTPEAAFALASSLAERFTSGETDAVFLLSSRFRSVIQQKVVVEQLLPIPRVELEGSEAPMPYLFEPSPRALLNTLLPRYVQTAVLRALLSSQAAEHAARMTAMEAASKNAAEMIEHLTLQYNRVRQASITKELIEIVSGAQALER
jgi:F-type H+-transporting ATPase subunit gamma